MTFLEDHQIVNCYSHIIYTLLNYYAVCDNNLNVKKITFQLKLGCVHTLAHKHNKSTQWAYLKFGKNCTVLDEYKKILAELPSDRYINEKSTKYNKLDANLNINLKLLNILNRYDFKLYKINTFFSECSVINCTNSNIEIYHIKKNYKKIKNNDIIFIVDLKNEKIVGIDSILTFLNRKIIFFCKQHHCDFKHGKISKINLDFLTKVNIKIVKNKIIKKLFYKGITHINIKNYFFKN